MDYRFDEKGKYYTRHVSKRETQVQVYAQGTVIIGWMHLLLDNRVKDELNSTEQFIALTHAEVRDLASNRILQQDQTIILNKSQITWIIPCGSEHEPPTSPLPSTCP